MEGKVGKKKTRRDLLENDSDDQQTKVPNSNPTHDEVDERCINSDYPRGENEV